MVASIDLSLSRRPAAGPWRKLIFRAGLAVGLLVTAFCLIWFDRGGFRDIDGELTFFRRALFHGYNHHHSRVRGHRAD